MPPSLTGERNHTRRTTRTGPATRKVMAGIPEEAKRMKEMNPHNDTTS